MTLEWQESLWIQKDTCKGWVCKWTNDGLVVVNGIIYALFHVWLQDKLL